MRFFRDPAANTLMATVAVGVAFIVIGALAYGAGHTALAIMCWACAALLFVLSALGAFWWLREPRPPQQIPNIPTPEHIPPAVQRKPEIDDKREITDAPLVEFSETFQRYTSVQADQLLKVYIGKWLRVSGRLSDAGDYGPFIQVTFQSVSGLLNREHHVYMYFGKKWADALAMIKKGEQITVIGQVKSIDLASLHLEKCELDKPLK